MPFRKIMTIILIFFSICFSQNFEANLPLLGNNNKLKIHHKNVLLSNQYGKNRINWNLKKTIGTSLMISCSILAYYCDDQADKYYSRYLATGDIDKMNDYYDKTEKFDNYKNLAYVGIEIGFCINVWSLIKDD